VGKFYAQIEKVSSFTKQKKKKKKDEQFFDATRQTLHQVQLDCFHWRNDSRCAREAGPRTSRGIRSRCGPQERGARESQMQALPSSSPSRGNAAVSLPRRRKAELEERDDQGHELHMVVLWSSVQRRKVPALQS
jgi:hypothetical protein